jgi:excinuclease ABC subunit B
LLDPVTIVRPTKFQIDDIIEELKKQIAKQEKTFITVLTIKLAESLCEYLINKNFKIAYLHNELKTIERSVIINDLRRGKYDAIVGINLLREGLDVPEVSLVLILDADKPGFFRSEKSLIQIFGRAARNINGRIIMYGDKMTDAMKNAINETNRRREIQQHYNEKHGTKPITIIKSINDDLISKSDDKLMESLFHKKNSIKDKTKAISTLRKEMLQAANNQEYERAIYLRNLIIELEKETKHV